MDTIPGYGGGVVGRTQDNIPVLVDLITKAEVDKAHHVILVCGLKRFTIGGGLGETVDCHPRNAAASLDEKSRILRERSRSQD